MNEQGEYFEEIRNLLLPGQLNFSKKIYLDGMHTYNASEEYEVIDIKTRRFNILNFMFRLLGKVRRKG